MSDPQSKALHARAAQVMPGGVNSPVRAFKAVGGAPVYIRRASGSKIYGVDGHEYIDYVGSWGPAILGHAHPAVVRAVQAAAEGGLSFGAPTEAELRFAEVVMDHYPSIEMLRCVSSGTEATMSALRAARGFTGRDVIVKFSGAYHGHVDALLVQAGSGAATFGAPDSAGVPAAMVENTITAPFNDAAVLRQLFDEQGPKIAAVIVEPVAGNMGCVPPEEGFLEALIGLCREHGALSIFDEVMTGCRLSRGGAQQRFGLKPDLTCLGKVVGGGLPLAVYGGRREIFERISPLGPVYQAGTLSGNPLAIAAGLQTLELLTGEVYEQLEARGRQLEEGLLSALATAGVTGIVQRVGAMLTLFFHDGPVRSWEDAKSCDTERFAKWHAGLLSRGIYWPPSQFEAAFLSSAHTEADVGKTVTAAAEALG